MVGFAPVIVAAVLIGARNLGWLPVGFWTQNVSQIAVAIELPILMVILMLRSQQRRENVRRIQGLDRVDPSTGLINSYVFNERLKRMAARSDRLGHQSAVMMVDIVNIAQTERDFGRKTAEELTLKVAERLLATAREIDSAARLAELRFGMLVEGPLGNEDAANLGPRIVARCLMPFKGMPRDCVAQVRVVYALVPFEDASARGLLTRLGEQLDKVNQAGDKRAVFVVADSKLASLSSGA